MSDWSETASPIEKPEPEMGGENSQGNSAEIEGLKKELETKKAELEKAYEKIAELERDLDLWVDKEGTKEHIEKLETDLDGYVNLASERQDRIEELEGQLEELKNRSVPEKSEELEPEKRCQAKDYEEHQKLKAENTELLSEKEALRLSNEDLVERVKDLESELATEKENKKTNSVSLNTQPKEEN